VLATRRRRKSHGDDDEEVVVGLKAKQQAHSEGEPIKA